jgi:membrane protein DedA with SNARE-associated domain
VLTFQARWIRWAAVAIFAVAVLPTLLFGLRTTRSLQLLRSAYETGAPETSSIRPWMTLRYVATRYRVPEDGLAARLGLAPETDVETSLRALAERSGLAPIDYVPRVQQAIADVAPPAASRPPEEKPDWFSPIGDQFLSALLVYGYPVLALTLLLGAIGLPVPTGLSVAVAGSLAAMGHLNWLWANAVAVGASILGDATGYGLGRVVGQRLFDRPGGWSRYLAAHRERAQALFDRWGAVTIVISRTLASHLSSVLSLLAGLARYPLPAFLVLDAVGRVIWTSAYFALGYTIGGHFDTATDFLTNVSVLLLCLVVLAGSGLVAARRNDRSDASVARS